MKVLKFGGSSVANAERMIQVSNLLEKNSRQVIVLSAMYGMTNQLAQIMQHIRSDDTRIALEVASSINQNAKQNLYKLFEKEYLDRNQVSEELNFIYSDLIELIYSSQASQQEHQILAIGERISVTLFHHLLLSKGFKSTILWSPDYIVLNEHGDVDTRGLQNKLIPAIQSDPMQKVIIMPGFICTDHLGDLANLGRGGSDYTATLIGAAIQAEEIQIWTDIDGMHNNDPRFVSNTFPVNSLSYNEAVELAYFGAKVLHPLTIHPARRAGINVRIKSTMNPQAQGTLIEQESNTSHVKAIAAKDEITQIKIESGRMLMAYGFLRKVFEVFEKYQTPIDMITTSEVSVSVTIDSTKRLYEIVAELNEYGVIEINENQAIICIVGDFLKHSYGRALEVIKCLNQIPVGMISYGGSNNSISLLINQEDKVQALNKLQEGLFINQNTFIETSINI